MARAMLKNDLRAAYLAKRAQTNSALVFDASLTIVNRLLEMPLWEHRYYHLFLPISDRNEIDTSLILTLLQGKDKEIVIPKMVGERALEHYLLTDSTVLKVNHWKIPEPVDGLQVPPEKIDVVFVPLLAFDLQGYRVGYGKGYYDAFLSQCRPSTLKIGLSMFEAVPAITDRESHDIKLDHCVTPEKVYTF